MPSRSRGLPSPTAASPLTQVLNTLTDPGTPGTAGSPGNQGTPDTSDTRGTSPHPKPAPREHVKLRRDLAAEMRDAVWFLTEHGRPRVQLGELLDEAIEAWLAEAKKTHNEGQDFPHRGLLR